MPPGGIDRLSKKGYIIDKQRDCPGRKVCFPVKNQNIPSILQLLLTPVLLIVLGITLIFHPDFASAAIARVLGWLLMAAGIGGIIAALVTRTGLVNKIIFVAVCFGIGGWMLANPLNLAAAIGRIVGILLAVRGIQDVAAAMQWKSGIFFPLLTAAVGVLLIVLPLTTSRLVFVICGIVVLLVGAAMLRDRLRLRNRLNPPDDGDIIDAL